MANLKAVLGAVVGGLLGSFVASKIPSDASILLAGILAGCGVRAFCGKQRNFLTGIIAAVCAILVALGFSYADSQKKIADAMNAPVIEMPQPSSDDDVDDEEEEDDVEEDAMEDEADADADESADTDADDADADDADAGDAGEDTSEETTDGGTADVAVSAPPEIGNRPPPGGTAMHGSPDMTLVQGKKPVETSTKELIYHGISAFLAYLIATGTAVAPIEKPPAAATEPNSPPEPQGGEG